LNNLSAAKGDSKGEMKSQIIRMILSGKLFI